MLLDEPLVNLDYKLREGCARKLTALFRRRPVHRGLCHHRPAEALLLAATRCAGRGRLLQYGPDGRGVPPPARSAWRAPSAIRR